MQKNHTDRWFLFTCAIEQGNVTWKNDLKCSFDCSSSENSLGNVCCLRCLDAGGVNDQCGSTEKVQVQYSLILALFWDYLIYSFLFGLFNFFFLFLNAEPLKPSELLETCRGCWERTAPGCDSDHYPALAPFTSTLSLLGKSLGAELNPLEGSV